MAPRELRKATIVGWTGFGNLDDLDSSIRRILRAAGVDGRVTPSGKSLVIQGPEPAAVVSALRTTPGVAWLSAGVAVSSFGGLGDAAKRLARNYLNPNSRFSVIGSGTDGLAPSDVTGAVVSSLLQEGRGGRVDENRPQVVIRASLGAGAGAVGVELAKGPGGVPTGRDTMTCFVSGGMHSSVLCWMALLSGYGLRMVHAKVDEESLAAVARLYSELSYRVAPGSLGLEVLTGTDAGALVNWAARRARRVFVGVHSGCGNQRWLRSRMEAPLYLAPEEWFKDQLDGLSLKPFPGRLSWADRARAPTETLSFDGVRADVSGVLDGLRGQTSPAS